MEDRDKIKELKANIKNLSHAQKLSLMEDLSESKLLEQQILNLSFNKKYGLQQNIMMGWDAENKVYRPIAVNDKGEIITAKAK